MNLNGLPQCLALGLSALAFGLAWAVGLLSGVPPHWVALRSLAAAGCFWVFGLVLGRTLLNSLCDAIGEGLRRRRNDRGRTDGGTT